jgi:hypothetical protein
LNHQPLVGERVGNHLPGAFVIPWSSTDASMSSLTKRTHWVVRLTHWINVIALPLMVASGLRIFNAYPGFARKGGTFCCYPFEGKPIPASLTFGGWLAGARHWHFRRHVDSRRQRHGVSRLPLHPWRVARAGTEAR